ncbi:MAG: hypothetical protein JNM28_02630 [Armatimonadetes bacterium]|nr:hypothetical protein [Armatimonadota bacterium]
MSTVWDDGICDGIQNMARDAGLLDSGSPIARVYGWDGPWVSLGRSQNSSASLKPGCPAPWVMRPTGGKAVLHGHDLTVGMAVPLEILGLGERDVKSVYRAVIPLLTRSLNAVGIPASLAEETPFVRGAGKVADCFAHVSPNDVVDPSTGQKVCGCALRLTNRMVLVQASIPVGKPLVDPSLVYDAPAAVGRHSSATRDELACALRTEFDSAGLG